MAERSCEKFSAAVGQCAVNLCAKYDMTIFEPEEIEAAIDEMIGEVNGNG